MDDQLFQILQSNPIPSELWFDPDTCPPPSLLSSGSISLVTGGEQFSEYIHYLNKELDLDDSDPFASLEYSWLFDSDEDRTLIEWFDKDMKKEFTWHPRMIQFVLQISNNQIHDAHEYLLDHFPKDLYHLLVDESRRRMQFRSFQLENVREQNAAASTLNIMDIPEDEIIVVKHEPISAKSPITESAPTTPAFTRILILNFSTSSNGNTTDT